MTIKEARQAAGLTQQQMADLTGIPKRTIENWDSGKSNPPEWAERLILDKLEEIKEKNEMYNLFDVTRHDALIMVCEKTVLVAPIQGIDDGMVPMVFANAIVNFPLKGTLRDGEPIDDVRDALPGKVWINEDGDAETDMDIAYDKWGDIPAMFGIRTGESDPAHYADNGYTGKVYTLDADSGDTYKFIAVDSWE